MFDSSEIWCAQPGTIERLQAALASPNAKMKTVQHSRTDRAIQVIPITGLLTKNRGFVQDYFGNLATSEIRTAVRNAAQDDDIDAILLYVDSPGGMTAGTADLAAEIRSAASVKPTWAFIEDLGASAAYWALSQAGRVDANRIAAVGSIGTYMVLSDFSGAAAAMGAKVHVVRSGIHKGVGAPGAPISDEQLAGVQSIVDAVQSVFTSDVSRARGITGSALDAITDGRIFVGEQARSAGLVDSISTLDETLAGLRAAANGSTPPLSQRSTISNSSPPASAVHPTQRTSTMSNDPVGEFNLRIEAHAQRYACSKAEAAIAVARERPDLHQRYLNAVNGRLEASQSSASPAANASEIVAEWDLRVAAHVQRTGSSKGDAAIAIAKSHPALHQNYLRAINGRTPQAQQAPAPASAADVKAIDAEVDRRIGALMGQGMPRSKAVSMVFGRDPDLHQRYLQAHNPGRVVGRP